MDKKITSTTFDNTAHPATSTTTITSKAQVSEKTLALIRSFAHNYYVDTRLHVGLQGMILG